MHEVKGLRKYFMKKPNRRGLVLYVIFFLLSAASPAFPEGQVTETKPAAQTSGQAGEQAKNDHSDPKKVIVARVNAAAISMDDVLRMMNSLGQNQGPGSDTGQDVEQLKNKALDRLIVQELVFQKAKAEGLKVEAAKLDEAIARLKQKLGGDKEYREFLEQGHLTEVDLKAILQRAFIIDLMYARQVTDKVVVSEDEAKKRYEQEKGKYVVPEKVSVADVVFFLPMDTGDSKKKTEQILDEIRRDKDKDPFKLTPADFFVVRDYDLTPRDWELYEAAKKLKEGELSDVIRTADSYHIIKLKLFKPMKQYSFEELKGVFMKKLAAEARQKILKEWEAELRKDAKVEILLPAVQ